MNGIDYTEHMSYEFLKNMKATHPAWKLLTAKYSPLAISFFYLEFVADNRREIPEYTLVSRLLQYLEELDFFDDELPSPSELLTQWSDANHGWLRKFYPNNSDDAHYDLTSTAQKAIEWIVSLKTESFIGTESRLIMVFRMLHEIVEQSESDPELRIKELERKKSEIDYEIEQARKGVVKTLEPIQVKERFVQAMQMSREILSDFRAVEQNFRELKKNMHEKIAGWDKGKGELLSDFFSTHDGIYQSEQGKSFQAFFDFLMSKAAQDEFDDTIEQVCALEVVRELSSLRNTRRIVRDWIAGGRHVQGTIASISEQLRRYVDENFLEEERRINKVIKNIEAVAIVLCTEAKPNGNFMEMDSIAPELSLPFDRPLFTPPAKVEFDEASNLEYGDRADSDDSALYSHISVDKDLLKSKIESLLEMQSEVTLAQVLEHFPISLGLAELLTYISIAQENPHNIIKTGITEPVFWTDSYGKVHRADFERIVYSREVGNENVK